MARIFKNPFAHAGDKVEIAESSQPDGRISIEDGWTTDYELPNDEPNYKPVERDEMNGLFNEVTAAIGEMQLNGFATWRVISGGWPESAIVAHSGSVWKSTTDSNNGEPGIDESWIPVPVTLGKVVEQVAPEDGGLLVDNQKTGAGLERVLTESDLDESPIGPLKGRLDIVSGGIQNQWIAPISVSRMERGTPFAYTGSVDDSGNQIVTRTNLDTGISESKTVYSAYVPDDHNAPAVKFLPSGDIIIACTGHADDAVVRYGVFKNWEEVGALPEAIGWSGSTSYVQIYVLANVVMLITRTATGTWSCRYSTDNAHTWSGEAVLFEHSTQSYMVGEEIIRSGTTDSSATDLVRVIVYSHPTNSATRELRRTGLRLFNGEPEIGTMAGGHRSLEDLISGSAEPFSFNELPVVWEPPAGKSSRLWDVAQSNDFMVLVSEFDAEAPHSNARYLLLDGVSSPDVIELPIAPGEDLPHDTYFPGACFVKKGTPERVSSGSVEIVVSSNADDIGGQHTVSYLRRKGPTDFDTAELFRSAKPLFRPFAIDGGVFADICISELDHYGGYRDFSGSTLLLSRVINKTANGVTVPAGAGENRDEPWGLNLGSVYMQGGYMDAGIGVDSGSFDLKIPLRRILHVSYDDVHGASSPFFDVATRGDYGSYETYNPGGARNPITSISWDAAGDVIGFRWMVIGIPF